jgi:ERCC4-type nuclease
MLELIIDCRENKLKEHFETKEGVSIEALDIGDILFKEDKENILVIERKTINDLSASICDGRHREQKARLLGSGIHKSRILYLIEGNIINKSSRGVKGGSDTLIGSLINTLFRDGIKVYKTNSIKESITFIEKLYVKLKKDKSKFWDYDSNHIVSTAKYSASLKTKKKANMTRDVWFHTQLCLIPQITGKVAKVIMENYPCVYKLVIKYHELSEKDAKELLKDITYPIKNGKTRRIGIKNSERIHSYFN